MLYETYIDIANWGRILHQNVNKELSHMFVERLQLSPKERYEQFNRRYPGLINRVKLKYVAAFLGISIYTLSRVRAKKIVFGRAFLLLSKRTSFRKPYLCHLKILTN